MILSAIADAFVRKEHYEAAVKAHPMFDLRTNAFFGVDDRFEMRQIARRIEVEGSESYPAPQETLDTIEEAEVLMVHLCPVSESLLKAGKNLKAVLSNRGGMENIDLAAATKLGIPVLCNPAHNANAVAEYTVGTIIALTRNIAYSYRGLRNGIWMEKFPNSGAMFELSGKTLGLIGFGTIARLVVKKLSTFNLNFTVYDPFVREDDPDLLAYNCRKVSLEELLSTADIVSLHARASSDKPLLGKKELSLMKKESYLINTARAYLVDNEYLYKMMKAEKIRGVAIDVFASEPVPADDPLLSLDNVLVTNHRGGDTVNAYSDSPAMVLSEAEKLLKGDFNNVRFWANKKDLLR